VFSSMPLPSYTQPFDTIAIRPQKKPPQWETDPEPWSALRIFMAKVVCSKRFDILAGIITIANIVAMIYQADYEAQCFPGYASNISACPFTDDPTLHAINLVFLIWYSLEVSVRIFAERLKYFKRPMNQIDILVTFVGWIAEASGASVNINFVRIIRVLRLARAFRLALQFRELYLMVDSMVASVKAIMIGTVLLLALMLIYAIVLVEIVHPKSSIIPESDCGDCKDGFSSVGHAVVSLFKTLIAGDSWIVGMPLIKPTPWLAPLMIFVVISITLGIMNLILTVIVERAADARAKDTHALAKAKAAARQELNEKLMSVCSQIDGDGDNQLTYEEMESAFDNCQEFQDLMLALDVQRHELELIMKVADKDCSGFLDYKEFCEELSRYKSYDSAMMIVLTRLSLQHIGMDIENIERRILKNLDYTSTRIDSHDTMLKSISERLDTLMGKPADLHARVTETQNTVPVEAVQSRVHQVNAEKVSVEAFLDEVQSEVQCMAAEGKMMLQHLEEQLSTMSRHAELVASLQKLGSSSNVSQRFNAKIGRTGKEPEAILNQLRQNVHVQRTVLMQEARQEIGVSGGFLDINTSLLSRLRSWLSCASDLPSGVVSRDASREACREASAAGLPSGAISRATTSAAGHTAAEAEAIALFI